MLENKTQDQEMVSLESLADLTGFPVKMIKEELFNSEAAQEKVSLDELRKAMVSYIDATMLEEANS
ncbi:MAG: hypothetical protein KC478_03615 [Bacteriovoracaceae bacterium]|nr:hypothetical protein [Bacteriovoracaceae bacterium]